MQSNSRFAHRSRAVRALAAAALGLALTGCFISQSRKEEADSKAAAIYGQCDQLRRTGKYTTHLAAVDCAVPTVAAAYQQAAYPFTDLVYISIQARRIGAHKVDTGEVSEGEYQHDLAELDTRLAAEDDRRRKLISHGSTPQRVAADTLVKGLNAFAPAPTAAAPPPPPTATATGCIPLSGLRSCK